MRSLESRQDEYYEKQCNALFKWHKRVDAITIKLARAFFAKEKKKRFSLALKTTARMTFLSKSERFKLAGSSDYAGYSWDEYPEFSSFITVDDLRPFFDFIGSPDVLDILIKEAEGLAKVPKILNEPEPKFMKHAYESNNIIDDADKVEINKLEINSLDNLADDWTKSIIEKKLKQRNKYNSENFKDFIVD